MSDTNMTVDLMTLKVGDFVKTEVGSVHLVTYISDWDGDNTSNFCFEPPILTKDGICYEVWKRNGKLWISDCHTECNIMEIIPQSLSTTPPHMRTVATETLRFNCGVKQDTGKPDFSCIPQDVMWEIAQVLTRGAERYGKWNWTQGFDHTRLIAGVQRHIAQWSMNMEQDDDSGKSHLTHAICGLMMLRALEMRGIGKDDRDKTSCEQSRLASSRYNES